MTGRSPPKASERTACWAARDAYFQCLDDQGLWLQGLKPTNYQETISIDPLNLTPSPDTWSNKKLYVCRSLKKDFDKKCLASWVSHFSMLRVKDLQTAEIAKKVKEDEEARAIKDDDFWKKVSSSSSPSSTSTEKKK